jgi:hypothetical protein
MSDTAQLYQKLLTDAIHKQMTVLGPQITLIKVRTIEGLTVTDDGSVASLSSNPEAVVTRFLEEFREISSPLVKKTMQPLLSTIGPKLDQAITQTPPPPNQTQNVNQASGNGNQGTGNKEQGKKLVPGP